MTGNQDKMLQIDRLLRNLPMEFAYRWCEPGPMGCACLGCCNLNGPLGKSGITKEEWQSWKEWKANQ